MGVMNFNDLAGDMSTGLVRVGPNPSCLTNGWETLLGRSSQLVSTFTWPMAKL